MKILMRLSVLFLFFVSIAVAQNSFQQTSLTALVGVITSHNGVLYAGSDDGNIYVSTDTGSTWTSHSYGSAVPVNGMAVSPTTGTFLIITEGNGGFRSTDNGITWVQIPNTAGAVFRTINMRTNGNFYLGTQNDGFFRSTDDGINWTPISSGVPESNVRSSLITNSGAILIGVKGSNGIYRTTDDGTTWTLTGFPQSYRIYTLCEAPNNYIYAGTGEFMHGIFRSTDDGLTWTNVYQSDTIQFNNSIAYDGNIYVGGLFNGVFRSTDNGNSWTVITNGFQSLIGFSLCGFGGYIFAGTGAGLYRSSNAVSAVNEDKNIAPNNFSLEQNYPDPFNPSTKIKYSIPNSEFVSLKVYDVLGKEVATLVNQQNGAGIHEVNFNASKLASGIYFYRLEAGKNILTRKMLLIK